MVALLHGRPEYPAVGTNFRVFAHGHVLGGGGGDFTALELYELEDSGGHLVVHLDEVLVDLAGTSAELLVAPVGRRPVEQVLGALALCPHGGGVEPQLLGAGARALGEDGVALAVPRPLYQLPAGPAAPVDLGVGPGRGDDEGCCDARHKQQQK